MDLQKARPAFFAAAAVYLFYLAWDLFKGRLNPENDMNPIVRWGFIALFALAAVALLVYAYRIWQARRRQENEKKDDTAGEVKDSEL